jgi:adenosylhomocysteine nucleosidase
MPPIGILAALHEEIADLLARMGSTVSTERIGMRDYHVGTIAGRQCVVVLARIGKVAAAATTVTLIREFGAAPIVFTGLAGGLGNGVKVGDVVVAQALVHHDFDARPLFPRYEVPLLGRAYFDTDPALVALLERCAGEYLALELRRDVDLLTRTLFGLDEPTVHRGVVSSGDLFVGNGQALDALRAALPDALCVEMEGAAVAQVCHEYGVPCAVLRTVSDRADSAAHTDFGLFLERVASFYSAGILRRFIAALP